MTHEPNADRSPRSPSGEERLAALRAHSPRTALLDRLSVLEGGIPGAAAYRAAQRLLPKEPPHPGMKPSPGAHWNTTEAVWEVDHAAAMELWEPRGDAGLPPAEMVDAFLAGYVERTGDVGERELVEQLYAEAEQELADRGGVAERSPANKAEALAVAARYGFGALVETITLDAPSRMLGLVLTLVIVPAFFGIVLLLQSGGDALALGGGVALLAVAAAALVWGLVSRRRPQQAAPQLFVFTHGIVFSVDGFLDPYVWTDLDLHETVVSSTAGSNPREIRTSLLVIGPRGRSMQFVVPSEYRQTVADLARAGGATIS